MNYELMARKIYNEIVMDNLGASTSVSIIEKEIKAAVRQEREESVKAIMGAFCQFNNMKKIDFITRISAVWFIIFKPVVFFKSVFRAMQVQLADEVKKREYK